MASEAVPAASDHISSSAGKLNHALTGYASAFVKKELQQLAAAYDDTLARSHVPKLRALLKEVDNERAAFEHEKDKLLQHLRTKLQRLDVEGPAIDAGLAELQSIAPRYLSVIPGTSALTIRPPTPIMSPPRENSYFTTVLGANLGPGEPTTGAQTSPVQAARLHESSTRPRSTPAVGRTLITPKPTQTSQIDDQVQEQVIAESTIAVQSQSTKRSRAESADEIKVSVAKRQRTDNDKSSTNVARRDIEQIAFPNLETGESIFRHAQRKGYFVIRCSLPDCAKPTFSEPPLAYNRALRHFENHSELIPDGEELTNEYIFEKFGWEITGSNLASKYWIKEHLGKVPHTFTPGKSRPRASRTDALSLPIKEQEDTDFVLSSNPRDSISAVDSEAEDSEQEMPRRTRRKVPRPDYAELVANRDLWNASDGESVVICPFNPSILGLEFFL
ncbi:hypothetical protein F4778DRAFT_799125 [Xylariomycetidae sp. FL2044]|nr:hypothetical protein F4778DRAFT_799125 [Xylariomycetidae sp. FL2044]